MHGHTASSVVTDPVFKYRRTELVNILQRTEAYMTSKGKNVSYVKELEKIENTSFGYDDMEKFKVLLQGMIEISEKTESTGKKILKYFKAL